MYLHRAALRIECDDARYGKIAAFPPPLPRTMEVGWRLLPMTPCHAFRVNFRPGNACLIFADPPSRTHVNKLKNKIGLLPCRRCTAPYRLRPATTDGRCHGRPLCVALARHCMVQVPGVCTYDIAQAEHRQLEQQCALVQKCAQQRDSHVTLFCGHLYPLGNAHHA
jgi:hypothetical protein